MPSEQGFGALRARPSMLSPCIPPQCDNAAICIAALLAAHSYLAGQGRPLDSACVPCACMRSQRSGPSRWQRPSSLSLRSHAGGPSAGGMPALEGAGCRCCMGGALAGRRHGRCGATTGQNRSLRWSAAGRRATHGAAADSSEGDDSEDGAPHEDEDADPRDLVARSAALSDAQMEAHRAAAAEHAAGTDAPGGAGAGSRQLRARAAQATRLAGASSQLSASPDHEATRGSPADMLRLRSIERPPRCRQKKGELLLGFFSCICMHAYVRMHMHSYALSFEPGLLPDE